MGWLQIVGSVAGFVIVPRGLLRVWKPETAWKYQWLPWVSVFFFSLAWFLPNPDLAETATFTQHAVGGGTASAVFSLYLALNLGVGNSVLRIVMAFCVTAILGVLLELFELAQEEIEPKGLTADTSWDLLANSIGALATAILLELIMFSITGYQMRRSAK